MNEPFDYIADALNAHLTNPFPEESPLITSRHFVGWVRARIQRKQQVIVNGLKCPEHEMQDRLRIIQQQIQQEFDGLATVKTLSFPYSDFELMQAVIQSLIGQYGASFSPDDAIITIGRLYNRQEDWASCLILTIVSTLVIV